MPHGKIAIGQSAFSASQVANLYGCGFGTKLEMYSNYIGQPMEKEISESSKTSMEFGTFFEESVARFMSKKKGWTLIRCGETAYWREDMPYLICHPDRLLRGRDDKGRRVAIEIKCVAPYAEGWGEEGTSEIPPHYYLQVQTYYACGVPCDVVLLWCLRGNRVYEYEILPDKAIIKDIRKRVRETKESFDKGIVPETETFEESKAFWSRRQDPSVESRVAGDEGRELWERAKKAKAESDRAEKELDEAKRLLSDFLGPYPSVVTTEGGKLVKIAYWGSRTRSSLNEERFAENHPDIDLGKYRETKTSSVLNIKWDKKEK